MDWLNPAKDQAVIDELNDACDATSLDYEDAGGEHTGTGKGKLKSSDKNPIVTCYELKNISGKTTKSPKSTKTPKSLI